MREVDHLLEVHKYQVDRCPLIHDKRETSHGG
jgi:hypothetical protein